MCECASYKKTASCKHITAAIIEIIFQKTELEMDEIEELALTSEFSADSDTTARIVPLFKEDIDSIPWHRFLCFPGNAFQHVFAISRNIRITQPAYDKIKLIEEDKDKAFWFFEFGFKGSVICNPQITYDRNQTFEYRCVR